MLQQHSPPPPSHPRRVPANLSVSVRCDGASAPQFRGHVNPPSSATRQVSNDSNESGDSAGGNAQKWFDHSNKHPEMDASFHFEDGEPPYFLPQISSNTSNEDRNVNNGQYRAPRPAMVQAVTNGSSADDYRSVIDDLTIENKKLKEKLRKYMKLNSAHLEKDKLFEVKIHSLPSRKRKELEDTLRKFASSLDESTSSDAQLKAPLTPQDGSGSKKPASSSTSNSRPQDSAYASMSNSAPTSTLIRNHADLEGKLPPHTRGGQKEQIQSFLHNIPKGLLLKHSLVMTERQKQKVVVRRLEQLFTGKRAVISGEHSQPQQQQEVSRSAARADQTEDDSPLSPEGLREAHMLPYLMDVDGARPGKLPEDRSGDTQTSRNISDSSDSPPERLSPEQRPTRPLDLDPDRAQVPADNVEYIRHLGLSTPQLASEDSTDSAADAEGWIYLNLLINMAQLHIISVTPDFVRAAVSDLSDKFQLSRDGKKLRWRGGSKGTQFSSDSGHSSNQQPDSDSLGDATGSRKRRKPHTGRFQSMPQEPLPAALQSSSSNAFHYKPLFHHQVSSSEAATSDASDSLYGRSRSGAKMSGWSAGSRSRSKPRRRYDEGPIVFYSGAKFCTDLSGDREGILPPRHFNAITHKQTTIPLGAETEPKPPVFSRTDSGSLFSFRPFRDYSKGPSWLDPTERPKTPDILRSETSSEGLAIDIPPPKRISSPIQELQRFEASGLGGTQPADHFALRVETLRTAPTERGVGEAATKPSPFSAPGPNSRKSRHSVAKESLDSFHAEKSAEAYITARLAALGSFSASSPPPAIPTEVARLPVKIQVKGVEMKKLDPSELPPPLGYYTSYSASSEDDSDDEDSNESDEDIRHLIRHGLSHTLFPVNPELEEEESHESMEDEEDGSSIDMLAQVRASDPEGVKTKEKEDAFEMQVLAGGVVRSSVATGGDGTGEDEEDGEEEGSGSDERMGDEG